MAHYVQQKSLPPYTQDIFRFINGQPVRVPTIDNIGINRFASIARSNDVGSCEGSHYPTPDDPRLMTAEQYQQYIKHPQPYGLNARLYGI